ncbi:phage tail protein [Microvirgula aerodenitrificans]|uniref:phage tail protein n=1 Tax=Microvirgula aerodenitrificans TaxID=57480 RepID=UPI0028E1926B|nr:phage tail protein [Microvirgula aerodenitrificans]
MSQKFYTVLTKIGEAKYANSTALKVPMRLTTLAVGDGGGATPAPTRDASRLVRELRRAPLNSLITDLNNPGQFIAEQIIPAEIGGWWIREMGIYDADGDLIAIGNCPDTYKPLLAEGSGRTQIIRMIMQFGSDALIELKIDPAVVLATRQYVDTGLKAHREEPDPHPQYLTPAELALAMADKADKHNAVLTGAPVAPTPPQFDNDTSVATTAFVQQALGNWRGFAANTAGGTFTLAAADAGKTIVLSGASVTGTLVLPKIGTVPDGAGWLIKCEAVTSNWSIATHADDGANMVVGQAVASVPIRRGDYAIITRGGGSWRVHGSVCLPYGDSFAASPAVSGYQKLPGGLIIQWGVLSDVVWVAGSFRSVSYPVAFPNAVLQSTATLSNLAGTQGRVNTNQPSNSQIQLMVDYAGAATVRYIAIGY